MLNQQLLFSVNKLFLELESMQRLLVGPYRRLQFGTVVFFIGIRGPTIAGPCRQIVDMQYFWEILSFSQSKCFGQQCVPIEKKLCVNYIMHKSNVEKCIRCLKTHTCVIVNHICDAKHIPLILHFLHQVANICPV